MVPRHLSPARRSANPAFLAAAAMALVVGACAPDGALAPDGGPQFNNAAVRTAVCHVNDEGEFHIIQVAARAVDAHLAHGDRLPSNGSCVATATIAGTVFDGKGTADTSDDLPLVGVLTTVRLKQNGTELASFVTFGGVFIFSGLAPGNYTVEAEAPGFQTGSVNVSLAAGDVATVNLRLQP